MSWWGKALGGAFGFMIGGPLGALMGIAFGHSFDRGLGKLDEHDFGVDQERIQASFFTATFSVMGYIAKADGRVSPEEIQLAEAVMSRLGLNSEMRASAKKLFNEGKAADFPIDDVMDQFRREVHRRTTLIQMFLEIQLQAAYADGVMHDAERDALRNICRHLLCGFDRPRSGAAGTLRGDAQARPSACRAHSDADRPLPCAAAPGLRCGTRPRGCRWRSPPTARGWGGRNSRPSSRGLPAWLSAASS